MKRKVFVALLSAAMLSITACGQESKPTSDATDTVANADSSVNEVLQFSNTPEPTPELSDLEGYSVKEICDLYLAGEELDEEICVEQGQGWLLIPGSEWASYYPGAVYPETDWEPEAVLQSYRDQTAPWVPVYNNCYALWDQDYIHRFEINEDWFYIDMVRVLPLVEETHAIAPENILQAYQAGEWDGEFWWSEDYSTRVRMNWYDGSLEYHYSKYDYSEEGDPMGLAYTGYGELPSYLSDERGNLFKSSNFRGASYSLSTRIDFYLDLPDGHLDGMQNIMRIEGVGAYAMLGNSIEQYYQGKLVQSWSVQVTDDSFIAPRWEDNTVFVYAGNRVLKLLDGGKTEVALNHVVGVDYGMEGTCYVLTLDKDNNGLLSCHEVFSGKSVDIAIDIVEVESQNGIIFYQEASGGVYALNPRLSHTFYYDDYSAYLGAEPMEYYIGEYNEFEGFFSKFVERYSSANEG